MDFLRLIRLPNLIIVAFTQYLLQYLLLIPAFKHSDLTPALDLPHFTLLVFSTILIAAGGYIVNDIFDYPTDLINKSEKVIINKSIVEKSAWKIYWGLFAVGLLISLYLAWHVDNLPLVLIYPAAWRLLYWYSKSLKSKVLWGNIIVSLFCAFVPGIVLFAERHTADEVWRKEEWFSIAGILLFLAYLVFAFLSTLYREIIKDMEDVKGDRLKAHQTLAVVGGLKMARLAATVTGLCLLIFLEYFAYVLWSSPKLLWGFVQIALAAPLVFTLVRLQLANDQKSFHQLSQWTKLIMLNGLIFLVLYYFHYS